MFTASHDYEKHLSDTRARLEDLLAPVYPTLPIDLRPSRLDDGFRGQARFSVNKSGDRLSVTGVEPVVGRASWESTLWILPGFAQRLAETIVQRVCSSYFRYPVRGFDLRLGYGTERAHLA